VKEFGGKWHKKLKKRNPNHECTVWGEKVDEDREGAVKSVRGGSDDGSAGHMLGVTLPTRLNRGTYLPPVEVDSELEDAGLGNVEDA
jgi:hypothetical protein